MTNIKCCRKFVKKPSPNGAAFWFASTFHLTNFLFKVWSSSKLLKRLYVTVDVDIKFNYNYKDRCFSRFHPVTSSAEIRPPVASMSQYLNLYFITSLLSSYKKNGYQRSKTVRWQNMERPSPSSPSLGSVHLKLKRLLGCWWTYIELFHIRIVGAKKCRCGVA